ncbi:MAG: hypothetical protein WC846_03050 [Candidatus Gracilibacteria bacterium]|jgi:hypothetical protein
MASNSQKVDPKGGSTSERPEILPVQSPEKATTEASLDDLKENLNKQELKKEERETLLTQILAKTLTDETKASLNAVVDTTEVDEKKMAILRDCTAYVLALEWYRNVEIGTVSDLITELRTSRDESLRFMSQILVKMVGKNGDPVGQYFQNSLWDEAKKDGGEILENMRSIDGYYKGLKAQEQAKEKEKKDKDNKGKSWYGKHSSEITTGLLIGGIGLGVWWLGKKIFGKADPENKVSAGAKVALGALVGAVGVGQALRFESVQKLIAHGDSSSWVYQPWAKGWAAAANAEFGVAADYWTGNGPSTAEMELFDQMGEIFSVSESRLWAMSKLGFDEFMEGKNSSLLPWAQDDDENVRTKIKDYFLPKLEQKLPYLKDPSQRKSVTLQQVLVDGYKRNVIKEVDLTDLSQKDRKGIDDREKEDDKATTEMATLLDKPEENVDALLRMSEGMKTELDQLDGAVDNAVQDGWVAFENLIGIDFDVGGDQPDEYRDLHEARQILHGFFLESGEVDHEFFRTQKDKVVEFMNFLRLHKNDKKPWTDAIKEDFADLKNEMLELRDNISASKRRAEVANLKRMEKDRTPGEIKDDVVEFADKVVFQGLSGAWHRMEYRLEKIQDGNKFYWALTIAQAVGVTSEFVGMDATQGLHMKPVNGKLDFAWKVANGAALKPFVFTCKWAYNGHKVFKAYRYSPSELFEKLLSGELSENEVKTRTRLANKFSDLYKSRWFRVRDSWLTAADTDLGYYARIEEHLPSLSEMQRCIDGEISSEGIRVDEAASLLDNEKIMTKAKLSEIRFYRILKGLHGTPHFNSVIAYLESGVKMSPETQAVWDSLTDPQKQTARDLIKTPEGKSVVSKFLKTKVVVDNVPRLLESAADGSSHKYRFASEEYTLTQSDIGAKAGEIAAIEIAEGRGPKPGGDTAAFDAANWDRAIQNLCEERFNTPIKLPEGKYRLAGQEFTIDQAELVRRSSPGSGVSEVDAARAMCVEQGTAHLAIEDMRITPEGIHEYKIGNEWIRTENPTTPAKFAEVRTAFEAEMAKTGRTFDFAKFAADTKLLKFYQLFSEVVGVPMAVAIIYYLHTAEDKREAICQVAGGLIAFEAGFRGAKMMDSRVARYVKDPRYRFVLDVVAGMAAAYGIAEPIGGLVENYFSKIPASHAVGGEVADIFSKAGYRFTSRAVLQSAEKGLIRKGMEKTGIKAFEKAFERRITVSFMGKIEQIAARQGVRQVLKILGWRGVTTAALLADDATVIGVVDDILAVGLSIWMSYDLIQIIRLIANAVEVQNQMEERQRFPITSVDIRGSQNRAAIQEKLIPYGLTVDRIYELPEDALFDILGTLPSVEIEIKREATIGSEVWTLTQGKATGIAVLDQYKNSVAEITGEDATEMDEAIDQIEKADVKLDDVPANNNDYYKEDVKEAG